MNQPGQWVDKVHQRKPIKEIILDMDSSDRYGRIYGELRGLGYDVHW